MRPQRRDLLLDVMDEQRAVRRDETLLAGARVLRRKRWRRVAVRSLALVGILAIAALSLPRTEAPRSRLAVSTPPVPDQPKELTDQELLALFPNTPVALASLDNGKKCLIFPRAGDEQRLVTRM
jgi:hypothetical protein